MYADCVHLRLKICFQQSKWGPLSVLLMSHLHAVTKEDVKSSCQWIRTSMEAHCNLVIGSGIIISSLPNQMVSLIIWMSMLIPR